MMIYNMDYNVQRMLHGHIKCEEQQLSAQISKLRVHLDLRKFIRNQLKKGKHSSKLNNPD